MMMPPMSHARMPSGRLPPVSERIFSALKKTPLPTTMPTTMQIAVNRPYFLCSSLPMVSYSPALFDFWGIGNTDRAKAGHMICGMRKRCCRKRKRLGKTETVCGLALQSFSRILLKNGIVNGLYIIHNYKLCKSFGKDAHVCSSRTNRRQAHPERGNLNEA